MGHQIDPWDTAFDSSMIDGVSKVVIRCPNEYLRGICAVILDESGVRYGNGASPREDANRGTYGDQFCYYVDGSRLYRGPVSSTYDYPWNLYKKCTIYDDSDNGNDIADESFLSIIKR